MVALGVLSDEELKGFSAQTRAKITEIHEGTPNNEAVKKSKIRRGS
jgi:hypothetical protein